MSSQKHDLLEIIIRLFCDRLIEAVRRGLPRRYIPMEADRAALRGRLDVQRQFTVLAASPQKLACRYEELSADIALNQIMRAAVTRLRPLARAPKTKPPHRAVVRFCGHRLRRGEPVTLGSRGARSNELRLEDAAESSRSFCSMTGFRRLAEDRRPVTPLLFEMNTLFEEYVGRMLRRGWPAPA